jgi:ribokinase
MDIKTTTKPHIAVVGSSWIEISLDVPKFPSPGETLYSGPIVEKPGGRAPTIALDLAALGCRVFFLSCFGFDDIGSRVISDIKKRGVNADFTERIENTSTGIMHSLRDPAGNTARLISKTAGPAMTRAPLLSAKAMISSCHAMVLLPDVPEDTFIFSIEVAHHFNAPVIVLADPAEGLPDRSLKNIDFLIINKYGAKHLTGIFPDTVGKADDALNHLIQKGVVAAVLYLEGEGAAASTAIRSTKFFPMRKSNAPDATEAEDAFAAGVAYGLTIGAPINEAVTLALANSAAMASRVERDCFPPLREIGRNLILNA